MDLDRARDIVLRLKPAFEEQGLEMEVLGETDGVVQLLARRRGPGAPVALMVRAVEGTFHRYAPDVKGVKLAAYEGLPEVPRPAPPPPGPPFQGLPGVDLAGADRRHAARALEAFADLVRRREGTRLRIKGLAEDAPLRAARKWAALYHDDLGTIHPEGGQPDTWIVHLSGVCEHLDTCGVGEEGDTLPAKVLVVE